MLHAALLSLAAVDVSHREQLARQQLASRGAAYSQTQRWNGAQAENAEVSRMKCSFTVPLDAAIARMPQNGTQECHYIYCDMHYNFWPGTTPDWKVFGQFVPQLMRGFCTSGNASGFAVRDTWLDGWYVQAQYIWSTPEAPGPKRVLAWAGELVEVAPGDQLTTEIDYGAGGYTMRIGAAGGRASELVVDTPFMGTNPRFTAKYGSAGAPDEYYRWSLGDLHEAWGMDAPEYYPTRMDWRVGFASEPSTVNHTARDDCKLHTGAGLPEVQPEPAGAAAPPRARGTCAPTVMRTSVGAVEPGAVAFRVERA